VEYRNLHPWNVTPQEAVQIQRTLREQVRAQDDFAGPLHSVAAMDVSYDRRSPWLFAGVVVLRLPGFEVIGRAGIRARAGFPYVPGLLSFRESPPALEAWRHLAIRPDCLICDGHGTAHPRRFGLACHLGLLVDMPTIGFAKRVLVGTCAEPGRSRGSVAELTDAGEHIGMAVRTREGAAPVYVSVGHRISLATAVQAVLACAPRYRIPEPVRQAHALVNRLREGALPSAPDLDGQAVESDTER